MTLRSLERGGSGVTMGAYLAVMQVLGIEQDLDLLGQTDPVGRELQDAQLPAHTKATRPGAPSSAIRPATGTRLPPLAGTAAERRHAIENSPPKPLRKPSENARDWMKNSGFESADALASLIEPLPSLKKNGR